MDSKDSTIQTKGLVELCHFLNFKLQCHALLTRLISHNLVKNEPNLQISFFLSSRLTWQQMESEGFFSLICVACLK